MTFSELPPWARMRVLRTLSTAGFLRLESAIRKLDGHADYCCNEIRGERGLAVPVGRNYNFTAIAWWAA